MNIQDFLRIYLSHRPLFLSLIRAKEAELFYKHSPFVGPVLDVGCGDGFFAQTVFGSNRSIDVGLDVADSRQIQAGTSGAYKQLVTYDGVTFPFRSGSFSTVLSNCVLEHVPHLPVVVGQMYRALRPGGTALVSVMSRRWEDYLAGSMLLGNSYTNWMRRKQVHLNLLSRAQWMKTFSDAGFHVDAHVGYLSSWACRLIDIAHYLSIPSLVTYVLFRRWVLWPRLTSLYPVSWLCRVISRNVSSEYSGAIFFVLHKPTAKR